MNDFDYENLQKKRIAQGARHKVNGSKSKHCTMPSDLLTNTQRNALNGECKTYQLDKPMDITEYKKLPDHIKKEYILHLRDKYKASNQQVYKMLGRSNNWWDGEAKRLCLPKTPHGGNRRNLDDQKAEWERFIGGDEQVNEPVNEQVNEQVKTDEVSTDVKRFDITVNSDNAYRCICELAKLTSCVSGSVKIRLSIEAVE